MNKVFLIGRLTQDPDMKTVAGSETQVVNFTLAVDRPFGKEKAADFIRCIGFGKTAEICERFLSKGSQAAVDGRIQTGSYKDKNGETKYTTDVIIERVEFVGSKQAERPKEAAPVSGCFAEDFDDICPF